VLGYARGRFEWRDDGSVAGARFAGLSVIPKPAGGVAALADASEAMLWLMLDLALVDAGFEA
jgi:predicted amidohydrolase